MINDPCWLFRKKNKQLLIIFACCLCELMKPQNTLSFGVRLNPSVTLAYSTSQSELNKNNFTLINFGVRPQLGLVASYALKKVIVDYSLFFGSKKVGLLFTNFAEPAADNYSKSFYKTSVLFNKISFGYLINKKDKPFRRLYCLFNFGIDFNTVRSESGTDNITTPYYYTIDSDLPVYPTTYISLSSGLSLKLRTRLKWLGLVDLGITYDHSFTHHPALIVNATIDNVSYYGKLVPGLDYLSFDFVKYFKIRQKKDAWKLFQKRSIIKGKLLWPKIF